MWSVDGSRKFDASLEFKNDHFELYANAFYNSISEFIYLNPTGNFIDEDPVYEYTQDDAKLYGGEIGLHIHPHPLDWLHIENAFETVTGKLTNDSYLPLIPANSLRNTIRIEFTNKDKFLNSSYAFITLQNVFDQNNFNEFEQRTGGYSLVNIGVGGTMMLATKELSFRITGNNIFNKDYVSHLSRLRVDNIANMGRNINFGFTLNL